MSISSRLKRLRSIELESEKLRKQLGCSRAGEVVFQATRSMWSDEDIIVEADGFGGATLLVVEGNYPISYSIKRQRRFTREDEACEAAEAMAR